MVGRALTILGVLLAILPGGSPALAQSDVRVSAQAVARATIMRPAFLRVGNGQVAHLDTAPTTDGLVRPKRLIRSCVTGENPRCTLIVFDLL